MYCRSILVPLKYTSKFPFFPNCITFFRFIHNHSVVWAKFHNTIDCFCNPPTESENNIKSSAQRRWPTIFSSIQIPCSDIEYCSRSDTYFRKRRPLQTPPWFTPISFRMGGLSIPLHLTSIALNLVFEYMFLRVSITRPLQPDLISL